MVELKTTTTKFNSIVLNRIKHLILPDYFSFKNLTSKKYSSGLCGFIGSNSTYTGGIFISAKTAMITGACQSHIFSHEDSVIALKTYGPEIIVHNSFSNKTEKMKLENEARWFKNFSTISYGTCMGRESYVDEMLTVFLNKVGNMGI